MTDRPSKVRRANPPRMKKALAELEQLHEVQRLEDEAKRDKTRTELATLRRTQAAAAGNILVMDHPL